MTIYRPYTYHLYHMPTGKHYYGVRHVNNRRAQANPSDLWTTYFTSSKKVKKLIQEYGSDSFVVTIRKTFDTAERALAWEYKVLRRLKVHTKSSWLNVSYHMCPNNYGRLRNDEFKQKCRSRMTGVSYRIGMKHSEETKDKISASRKGKYSPTTEHRAKINAAIGSTVRVTFPDGETETVNNLRAFCKLHTLDTSHANKVMNGKLRKHKGYHFERL